MANLVLSKENFIKVINRSTGLSWRSTPWDYSGDERDVFIKRVMHYLTRTNGYGGILGKHNKDKTSGKEFNGLTFAEYATFTELKEAIINENDILE